MDKPQFDPTQPFQAIGAQQSAAKPAFDPAQPFTTPSDSGPDQPEAKNLFGDDTSRAASSFGNDAGIANMLKQKGFKDVKRNAAGDLVAQGQDGKWYKDADNFFANREGLAGWLPDHPVNFAEAHLGKALPVIGMAAGGAAGGAETLGAGAIPGAMAGAGAGEALRQAGGRSMGVYDGDASDSASDIGKEAIAGGMGEMGGKLIGAAASKIPMPRTGGSSIADSASNAIPTLMNLGKQGVAKASNFISGAPEEAVTRLIERPKQVMGAEDPGNALRVAQKANDELTARNQAERDAISGARQKFRDQFGDQQVDTSPMIQRNADFMQKSEPNADGFGPISPEEASQLGDMQKKALTTPKPTPYGDQATNEPVKSAGDLQKFADFLKTQIDKFDQSKLPGTGDTPFQAKLRGMYGQVKGALHQVDPDGLGQADAQFSQYAKDAGFLKQLDKEQTMEGFINNFYGKNKSLMRESAARVIPDSMDDVADVGASKAFDKQGPAGSDMGKRTMAGAAGAGVLGLEAAMHGSPLMAAGAAALPFVTSPGVHRAVIGGISSGMEDLAAAPWFKAIKANPQLLESISNPGLKDAVQRMLSSGGEAMPAFAGNDNRSIASETEAPDQRTPVHPEDAKQNYLNGGQ